MLVRNMLCSHHRPRFAPGWLAAPVALALICSCAAPKPPPPKPKPQPDSMEPEPDEIGDIEPEPIETGKDCVTATTECGGGVCIAHVKNDCEQPVTCDFDIMTSCKTGTSTGQAHSSGTETFRAKTEDRMSASGDCAGGEVLFTVAEGMSCK